MAKHYEKKEKTTKKNWFINFILNLMLIIFVGLLIVSSAQITKWYINNKKNEKVKEEISEAIIIEEKESEKKYSVDFNKLKEKNSDTVAWLKVNNTDIEFAVVKTTNNGYYLSRNFNKEYNLGGWIFADYRNKFDGTDKNIIIYGHNMRDGSMFGDLKDVIKKEWYNKQENHEITFITENESVKYKVFSVYQIEAEDYYIQTSFRDNQEFKTFADTLKKRSIKKFHTEITEEDSILTLSTCANDNKYRIVLHAKKIK